MTEIGPVQLLAIGFASDAEYKGDILAELERLNGKNLIRVLDLLFVGVDAETEELVAFDYQGDALGGLVGALLGFNFEGVATESVAVKAAPGRESVGLSRAHLEELIRKAPPEVAIGLLLIEHVWARDLKRAIRDAGGVPLAEGFLSAEALAEIGVELEAMVHILDELEHEEEAGVPAG
jgi:hypothetical protein